MTEQNPSQDYSLINLQKENERLKGMLQELEKEVNLLHKIWSVSQVIQVLEGWIGKSAFLNDEIYKGACETLEFLKERFSSPKADDDYYLDLKLDK